MKRTIQLIEICAGDRRLSWPDRLWYLVGFAVLLYGVFGRFE